MDGSVAAQCQGSPERLLVRFRTYGERRYLAARLGGFGIEVNDGDTEIIESSSFSMVDGYYSTGRDIRVKCQIKPGVIRRLA